MARGLVYTAVMGGYDKPKPVRVKELGVDYIMVTDGDGAKGWDVNRAKLTEDSRMAARRMKVCMPFFAHQKYDWFLWVDGTMEIIGPVRKFAESALKDHDFAAWKHPWWQCSYTEVDKCLSMKKDKPDRLEKGRQLLQKRKFPKDHGQLATWVLLRSNSPVVKVHARSWWDDMVATTMRDQVTFMMNLWRVAEGIQWLPGTVDDAKWLNTFDWVRCSSAGEAVRCEGEYREREAGPGEARAPSQELEVFCDGGPPGPCLTVHFSPTSE